MSKDDWRAIGDLALGANVRAEVRLVAVPKGPERIKVLSLLHAGCL
jgi:hypothetical protein